MLRFEEGLALYIRNQLAGQPVQSSQELYKRVAEVERVKKELRILGQVNPKKRWLDQGSHVEGTPNKKPALAKRKPQNSTTARKHCSKCGRTNHDTAECRLGTNRCFWCGDPNHPIANFLAQLSSRHKVLSSVLKGAKAATLMTKQSVGRAYVINTKQAHEAATVMTSTLTFNSVPFIVLFDSGGTRSFISSNTVSRIGYSLHTSPVDLLVSLPAGQVVECHVMFKNCPLSINQEVFEVDLIQLDPLKFDVVLTMDWLSKYKATIDYQRKKVTLKGRKGKRATI